MFKIITDTSANLPTEYLRSNDITVVPFIFRIDGKEDECLDTALFDGKKYYGAMRDGADVTTSQISPQKFTEAFEEALRAGQDILYIGMSSGISGTIQSANIAKESLAEQYPGRKIYVVDTLAASLGEGISVMRAVEERANGTDIDEIYSSLIELRPRVCQIFTVDDLAYLKRGGRISGATALVGSVLGIKPILKANSLGQIVKKGMARGKRKALEELARLYDELVVDAPNQTVCISHADCEEDALMLEEMLRRNNPPKSFFTVCYEPVTGAHVGPGTVALFFIGDENVRNA